MEKRSIHTISIRKINHREAYHIGLFFKYDDSIIEKIKTIPGRRFSATKRCWYLPYIKESYTAFKRLNIPHTIDTGTTDLSLSISDDAGIFSLTEETLVPPAKKTIQDANIHSEPMKMPIVCWNKDRFILKIDYNEADVAFLKGLKGSWWNSYEKVWIVHGTVKNLDQLNQYFSCFTPEKYTQLYELIRMSLEPVTLQLYKTPQYPEHIVLKLLGFKADVNFIKSLPNRSYDSALKRWIIPADPALIRRIKEHYTEQEVEIVDRIAKEDLHYTKQKLSTKDRIKKLIRKFPTVYTSMIEKVVNAMIREKYSFNTVTSYVGKLVVFRKQYANRKMDELTISDANSYLTLLAKQDVSESLLNMVYSAIKLYYDKVAYVPSFELQKMKRPRRGRYLPVILSRQEVDRMLKSISNTKHLCILYTLYGAGLRLGELLNLRVEDVMWDRNQLLIKGGKGKKDRVVMLSDTLKKLLELYFDEYQPEFWLFEGAKKGMTYSPRSVQALVRNTARKAGIGKRVSPHTLRHCFATHLMDGGLDSRYIQKLLGHEDIKTTLIYTHVTNRSMSQIISPLDFVNNNKKIRD